MDPGTVPPCPGARWEGGHHTIYGIGSLQNIAVGRHNEIPEGTARKILKLADTAPAAAEDNEDAE